MEFIRLIKDKSKNIIYPITVGSAIKFQDGKSLDTVISELNTTVDKVKFTSVVNVTATKSIALSDINTLQKCSSASAIKIMIANDATTNFPIGSQIVIGRFGAGTVYVEPASGVTLNSSGAKKYINSQNEGATLVKIGANEWWLLGSLS